jgi:hypothetical protein
MAECDRMARSSEEAWRGLPPGRLPWREAPARTADCKRARRGFGEVSLDAVASERVRREVPSDAVAP